MSIAFSSIRHTLKHSAGGRRLGTHHRQLTGRTTLPLPSFSPSSPPGHNAAGTAIAATQTTCRSYALYLAPHLNMPVEELDPQSRSAINIERYEYSQSGSDSAVAAQQSAWDPANITPEMVLGASRQEALSDGRGLISPLEVSPANQAISMSTDEAGRGEWVRKGPSRRVSPPKGKKVDCEGRIVATYGTLVG